MRGTVTYRYQLREFFTLLHDFGCLPGLFTLAAKGLICDSTFPSLGSCLLVDGVYLAAALPAVYQVTKNSAENEHKTLMQSALFKLMPLASAADLGIVDGGQAAAMSAFRDSGSCPLLVDTFPFLLEDSVQQNDLASTDR